jgi:hypothetical protein
VRGRLAIAVAAAALLTLGLGACGDVGRTGDGETTAIGTGVAPGKGAAAAPPGAPYDVDGRGWAKLQQVGQFQAATAYVADNPQACGDVDVGAVALYVTAAYGADRRAADTPAVELLAEGCQAGG